MTVGDYIKKSCTTEGLAPLSKQIASVLLSRVSGVLDISSHVQIVGPSTLPYLQRPAGEALVAAVNEFGRKPKITHALRVLPQQAAVSYWYLHGRKCGITLAAMPGESPHERAVSLDVDDWEEWIPVLKRHNWIWRGMQDKWHFNFHGPSNPDFGHEGIKAFQWLYSQHNAEQLTLDGSYGPKTQMALLASPIAGWPT